MSTPKILKEVAQDAKDKRGKLIAAYKTQGRGNVLIKLKHGFSYKYGETIPEPQIVFPGMNCEQMSDWDFWAKAEKM